MTEKTFSLKDVISFLENARDFGVMKFNTARTRKTAIIQLSQYLSPEEKSDLRLIVPSKLAERIRQKAGIQEGTLQTYLTRLEKTIKAYNDMKGIINKEKIVDKAIQQPSLFGAEYQRKETLAIAIDGIIVRITNLPSNLSISEADKICAVLRDFAERESI